MKNIKIQVLSACTAIALLFGFTALPASAATAVSAGRSVTVLETKGDAPVGDRVSSAPGKNAVNEKPKRIEVRERKAVKKYTYKNDAGKTIAVYKLTATFQYTGSSVSCKSATFSTTVSNKYPNWKFSKTSTAHTNNSATGRFTLKKSLLGITTKSISQKLTITCDKNGNIA